MKNSITNADLRGKTVVVRADLNVPLSHNAGVTTVTDDTRIRGALPTLAHIVESGGRAVVLSHLGRPKGERKPEFSLAPVAAHLDSIANFPVSFCPETTGPAARRAVEATEFGGVVVMENTRYDSREKENNDEFSRELSSLGEVFVNDAFGSAHRAHASTTGIAQFVNERYFGLLMQREVEYLNKLLTGAERPFVAILGGAKVSDKIGVIENLLPKVDRLLIGGAMSYTFLASAGIEVGNSMVEEDKFATARELVSKAGEKLMLPSDHVVAKEFDNESESEITISSIPADSMGLDIGPDTIKIYSSVIEEAKTVVWNGPMGVFEMPSFASGTLAVAQAMSASTKSGALTVVGGGDSVAAITQAGLDDDVSHVSTGGGAMLEFLEGNRLPGITAIENL